MSICNLRNQAPTYYDAELHGNIRSTPMMIHEVNIEKADSALTIELFPDSLDGNLVVLMDYERMPSPKKYHFGAMATGQSGVMEESRGGGPSVRAKRH